MPSEAEASSVVAPDFPLQRDTRGGPLPSRIAKWHQDHLLQHSMLEYVVSAMHSFSGQDCRAVAKCMAERWIQYFGPPMGGHR